LSKASFSDVKENFKKDNFTGFFIGPMAEFNIPVVGLGVDASFIASKLNALASIIIFSLMYVDISIVYCHCGLFENYN
jgi:hypothetical protein